MQTTTRTALAAAVLGLTAFGSRLHCAAAGLPRRGDLDCRHPPRHPAGPHHLRGRGPGLSRRARAYNGVSNYLVTADGAEFRSRPARSAPARRWRSRPRPSRSATLLPDFERIHGPADRVRPDGGDRVRSRGAAAVRHDRRHPQRRTGERARHDQHPRRAVGDLQGRSRHGTRRRVRCRPARRRCARSCASMPDALERAAELDAQVRQGAGSRRAADVLRAVLVQGSVRHQGHAVDRRRRRALRHRLPGARSHAGRAAARQGRDHLRQGQHHRVQRPRRRSRRQEHARQGAGLDARLPAQHLGRQPDATRTTRRGRRRSARARARACRSAPTSSCAACARRRARRAAARPTTTRWRCSCRRRR